MDNLLRNLCIGLLRFCLPKHVCETLTGDLLEHYTKLSSLSRSEANFWLLKQALMSSAVFLFTIRNMLKTALVFTGMFLFALLAYGIMYLSGMEDGGRLSAGFWAEWQAGRPHQLFFEGDFWRFIIDQRPEASIGMWFDLKAMMYAFLSSYLIYRLDRLFQFRFCPYFFLSMAVLCLPYVVGSIVFVALNPELRMTGPIVALMWFSILYLVLPVSFMLAQKIKQESFLVSV